MDINEGDISLGSKNNSIQTRVIDSSGVGVNAESSRGLAFAACDPLSELVWSPHKGLSMIVANNSAEEKPFLLWNVNKAWGSRDEGGDDMFVDKAALLQPLENRGCATELGLRLLSSGDCDDRGSNAKTEEADNQDSLEIAEITKHTADLQPQKVPDDEATSAADAPSKNERNMPTSVLAPPSKNSPLVESFETKNRISLYKAKGKEIALSDGDDDEDLFSRGIKRRGCIKDIMQGRKKIKNQIPLCSGSTPIPRPDGSFISWISSMVRGFSVSNGEASSSFPMPLACSIDAQDSARLNMGFQSIFQPLICKDMNILNTIEGKENESMEESGQLMVEDTKTLDDLCLSKQIIVCDGEVNPILVSNQARDGVMPAESFGEVMNYAAEKASVGGTSGAPQKGNFFGSLWVTRLCTKSPRSKKCQEIVQETIGCSTSCSKLNLEIGTNVVFPFKQKSLESTDEVNQKSSTNTDVSSDLKCCKKFGSSEGMTSVFARRLDAFRRIIPSENNVRKDHQKSPLHESNVSAHNTVEIFRAIRNLRLSRADILRWMNSDVSLLRLNGYFLRLRLKKLEQGLEDASYYVACISAGDDGELINDCTSKKCILVDVEGIKSCITSQYVSNHDFLEDEIRAWLCRAVDRGCTVPSIDELNTRFNNRTSLGF